jgi:hypothetical protein
MEAAKLAQGILNNLQENLMRTLEGLSQEEIEYQPDKESNSIGFILWHQTRAEDMMVNNILQGKPEIWETGGWAKKLGYPEDFNDSGWGYTAEQLAEFKTPPLQSLKSYAETVRAATEAYLSDLKPESLDEVKTAPFGEMPASAVLTMLLNELGLHIGQITYIRGLKRGLNK